MVEVGAKQTQLRKMAKAQTKSQVQGKEFMVDGDEYGDRRYITPRRTVERKKFLGIPYNSYGPWEYEDTSGDVFRWLKKNCYVNTRTGKEYTRV